MKQMMMDLFWRWHRRCPDCGHAFPKDEMTLWGRCRSCENGRLSI